jgi:hypothetical protein
LSGLFLVFTTMNKATAQLFTSGHHLDVIVVARAFDARLAAAAIRRN